MEGMYVGKDKILGFIKGHKYEIEIDKPNGLYCYVLTATKDLTTNTDGEWIINYASSISINKNWLTTDKKRGIME